MTKKIISAFCLILIIASMLFFTGCSGKGSGGGAGTGISGSGE